MSTSKINEVVRILSIIFFVFEIFFRHNVGYYTKGKLVMDQTTIKQNYRSKFIMIDLIGNLFDIEIILHIYEFILK